MSSSARTLLAFGFAVLILLTFSSPTVGAEKTVFVTSVSGTGNLGLWPDAGNSTGIEAADAICRARAAAASLTDPSTYIAWISDSTDDAYCRVHGLTGKKDADCGETSLPAWAGPWLRTDGLPIGETIELLLWPDYHSYLPINLDEFGNPITYDTKYYFTNTNNDGVFRDQFDGCVDWTSSDPIEVRVGGANWTSSGWTDALSSFCNRDQGLLCLQPGTGDPGPPFETYGARVFVTYEWGAGNLAAWPQAGGQVSATAGDAICQNLAASAGLGLPSSYMAWLSTSTENAIDRFTYDGPWIRLDGVPVAMGKTDLVDGEVFTSVNLTEWGDYYGGRGAWTGTTTAGLVASDTCDDWTDGSGSYDGATGIVNTVDEWWTDRTPRDCSFDNYHLYCFSQVAFLFADGFELGDISRWSFTTP